MTFKKAELPFAKDALEPYMSRETLNYHYDKHHQGYVDKLEAGIDDSQRDQSLEQVILQVEKPLFNSAAQVWNHDFFWQCLTPEQPKLQDKRLAALIERSFGGREQFEERFAKIAAAEFGSGWAWLAYDPKAGELDVFSTTDAENPLSMSVTPLLTLDVWEHAYYLDYKHDRPAYIEAFLKHLINWDFAARNLAAAENAR